MNHTFEMSNGILVLKFSGGLLALNSDFELTELIQEKISENILLCAIDISEVNHINSSGLGFLITILTKFRNKGGEIYIINPSEQVKKMLIITKLNAIFNVAATKEEAMYKLSKVIL